MKTFFFTLFLSFLPLIACSQTKIAKEQIEDVFLRNDGGSVYGDITAATSTVTAHTLGLEAGERVFHLFYDGDHAMIRSDLDLYLDPTNNGMAGGKIVPVTMMEFPDFLGDKIRFFDTSYKIGVSPFCLDITSDEDIRFHADTLPDLMVISGTAGDVTVRRHLMANGDIKAGGVFAFMDDTTGDKILLWGDIYKIAIALESMDFYSGRYFTWNSDSVSSAMQLDADSGKLTLSGALQLPIFTTLPSGNVGELIYLDHPSDDSQDGAYIKTAAGWQQL